MSNIIKYPFGPASEVALSASGDQAIELENSLTIIDGVSTPATGDRTLNLTIPEDLEVGARLVIRMKTAATESTIFGTGITGTSVVGIAGKTKTVEAVYNGTVFEVIGTAGQID